jgi:hypothetical protein
MLAKTRLAVHPMNHRRIWFVCFRSLNPADDLAGAPSSSDKRSPARAAGDGTSELAETCNLTESCSF